MEYIKITDNKRIVRNTLYMYVRMVVMMVISLFTTRITFQLLGVDNYGIYNIVGSIIVFFIIINNSLVTATRRYITAELVKGTVETQKQVFATAVISHVIIALIVVVFAEIIGVWVVNSMLNIPKDRLFAANIVYQISIITSVVGITQTPYNAVITAHEKMSIYAYFSVLEALFKFVVVGALFYFPGDKLIVYSVTILFSSVLIMFLYRYYCKRSFSECSFRYSQIKLSLLKEMFGFMGWNLFGQTAVVFTNQGVSVLVNVFFTVAANAAMGISNQITGIVTNFSNNFQTAFHPQITKLFVIKDYEELAKLSINCSRISSFLLLFFIIPIIFQIHNFLTLWLGDYPNYAVEFCIFTLTAVYLDSITTPFWMICLSDTNLRAYQIGVASIISLCFFLGWGALAIGLPPYSVVVVRTAVFGLLIPYRIYMVKQKVPNYPVWRWVKEVLFNSMLVILIPCSIMFVFDKIFFNNIIVCFCVNCSLCAVLMAGFIYLFGLTNAERSFVRNKIITILS